REMSKNIYDNMQTSITDKLDSFKKNTDEKLESMRNVTNDKLETIRSTVDEKLEKTLTERLGKSFETVGKQLGEVQKGLGEMQSLAQDVGGLKRVLSNVKMRGGLGEVQLGMLLEQILAPDQFAANVHVRPRSQQVVEYAVKLPGKDETADHIWLPIDAKFPRESYERLQMAYEAADPEAVNNERNALYRDIKKMAADIQEKYICPPYTTDFAIMFLPFEGIYSEVVRSASLLQELQNNYKVILTGPTTLAALLNSLQMGFRTLAIQKRSSEVWKVLAGVKKEFSTFGALIAKSKKNIELGLENLNELEGVRTRQIQSKLKKIEETDTDLLEESASIHPNL
ncbi:MAG: DNA recombination protein RmuC, partial [Bacteroidales bacterium]|nr:DNA recombination protein RmuC [Bacteroidales bacterium]